MKDIAIYGAGGFGREVALLIEQINNESKKWNFIGFIDDDPTHNAKVPFLGSGEAANRTLNNVSIAVAIANSSSRAKIVSGLTNRTFDFPVLSHPGANLGSTSNHFGRGTIITDGVILTTGIFIGEFVIVNLATTIGHDVHIGDYCSVMPGTNLSGNVKVGSGSLIGTGAKVLQNITIGENVRVGAGAVVVRHVADHQTVVGIPAKPI